MNFCFAWSRCSSTTSPTVSHASLTSGASSRPTCWAFAASVNVSRAASSDRSRLSCSVASFRRRSVSSRYASSGSGSVAGGPGAGVPTAAAGDGRGLYPVLTQIVRSELGVEEVIVHPADTSRGSAGATSVRSKPTMRRPLPASARSRKQACAKDRPPGTGVPVCRSRRAFGCCRGQALQRFRRSASASRRVPPSTPAAPARVPCADLRAVVRPDQTPVRACGGSLPGDATA